MDEPHQISGSGHQQFRHNQYKTPIEAEHIFWESTPETYRRFIRDAVLDHIILDKNDTNEKRKTGETKKSPIISASLTVEQSKWLDSHPELNRSKIFQDAIDELISGNTNKKQNKFTYKYLKIIVVISLMTFIIMLLMFVFLIFFSK